MIFINNRIIVDANLASKEHTFINEKHGSTARVISYDDNNYIQLDGKIVKSLNKYESYDLPSKSVDSDEVTSTGYTSVTSVEGLDKVEQFTSREHAGTIFATRAQDNGATTLSLRCAKVHADELLTPAVTSGNGPTGQSKKTAAFSCLSIKQQKPHRTMNK